MRQSIGSLALAAYHCTRVTGEEITDIRGRGLMPLSADGAWARIDRLVASDLIDQSVADQLRRGSRADDANRRGVVWCFAARQILRDEGSISRLFRSWGGEALYLANESDFVLGPLLLSLGKPAIVDVAIPIARLPASSPIAEALIATFLRAHGDSAECDLGDIKIDGPVPVDWIVGVTTRDQAAFVERTGCDRWRVPL